MESISHSIEPMDICRPETAEKRSSPLPRPIRQAISIFYISALCTLPALIGCGGKRTEQVNAGESREAWAPPNQEIAIITPEGSDCDITVELTDLLHVSEIFPVDYPSIREKIPSFGREDIQVQLVENRSNEGFFFSIHCS